MNIDKWIEDINFLLNFIYSKHPDLFHDSKEEEFNIKVNSLKNNLNKLSDIEIIIELLKIVASLNDEHLNIFMQPDFFNKLYPFETELFNNRLYLTCIHNKYSEYLGKEIIKINNIDIELILSKFITIIPHNTKQWAMCMIPQLLFFPYVLYGLNITNNVDDVITITVNDDKSFDVIELLSIEYTDVSADELVALDNNTILVNKSINRGNYYWYEILNEYNSIYINYNRCRNIKNKNFEAFVDEVFEIIEINNHLEKIIIDLRYNGGGDSSIFKCMINKLKSHRLNTKDNLFTLINANTFSSGVMNAADLKFQTNSTIVGTSTGGLLNGYGNIVEDITPNYKLKICCPTKFINAKGNYDNIPSDYPNYVIPDIEIKETIENYMIGKDSQLEYILNK